MKGKYLALLLFVAGCNGSKSPNDSKPVKSDIASFELPGDNQVIGAVRFKPGSRALHEENVAEIDEALRAARTRGPIRKVRILVWNRERENIKNASEKPKLTADRGQSIKGFVDHREPKASIQITNVSARPEYLQRYIKRQTPDVQEKLTSLRNDKEVAALIVFQTEDAILE